MRFNFVAAALLVFMGVLAWTAALRESVTFDEVAHVGAGLSYLQKLDMRFNEEHPPLAKALAAIPLTLAGTRADYGGPVWNNSASFFSGLAGEWFFGSQVLMRWNDPARTLALARLPMLLLTLILGWCVFHFARRLGGDWAGVLCLTVYASSPLFLGVGPLVLTDVPLTLFALLSTWELANIWHSPRRRHVILFSLSFAAAILTKFSSGLLFFAFAACVLMFWRWPDEAGAWRKQRLRATLAGVLLTLCWVYLFCLVLSWNQPVDIPGFTGGGWERVCGRLLMPPWLYLRGMVLFVMMAPGTTFILGREYVKGVWFYFPVLLILKSAPGFLGLLALLPIVRWRGHGDESGGAPDLRQHWRILWVTLLVFGAICIGSHYNTDLRHFGLPVVLMILLLSALPRQLDRLGRGIARPALRIATAALAVSCLITAVRAYPNFIPYISMFGMGHPGWSLVSVGNLDRGQSLDDATRFAQARGIQDLPVAVFYPTDVRSWTPQGRPWNCQALESTDAGRWVVISTGHILHGRRCGWLMQYPHEELGGGSMVAIHLPASIPAPGTEHRPVTSGIMALSKFGIEEDMQSTYMDVLDHPEKFPALVAPFEAGASTEARRKFERLGRMLHLRPR